MNNVYVVCEEHTNNDKRIKTGYWCIMCGKFLHADEKGVIVHDDVPHPVDMTFDEDKVFQ